jgi:hypothetical protein
MNNEALSDARLTVPILLPDVGKVNQDVPENSPVL